MHGRERAHHERDNNRLVRPFDWGLDFIMRSCERRRSARTCFATISQQAMAHSEDFYALPEISDLQLDGDQLTWTSAIQTPSAENNMARPYFPVNEQKRTTAHRGRCPAAMECST